MASIKRLKKEINYVLGDAITYTLEMAAIKKNNAAGNTIVDEIIDVFDDLIAKLNVNNIENKKTYFKKLKNELHNKSAEIIKKVNKL